MKRMKWIITAIMISTVSVWIWAQSDTGAAPTSETVFVDVSKFGRKDRLARRMTKLHTQRAAQGWIFVNAEIYLENGDMEGMFVTYRRQ